MKQRTHALYNTSCWFMKKAMWDVGRKEEMVVRVTTR